MLDCSRKQFVDLQYDKTQCVQSFVPHDAGKLKHRYEWPYSRYVIDQYVVLLKSGHHIVADMMLQGVW